MNTSTLPQPTAASISPALADFDRLPDSALIDVATVARVMSYSRNHVWRLARSGKLPKPIKLGPNSTRWKVSEIRAALAVLTA